MRDFSLEFHAEMARHEIVGAAMGVFHSGTSAYYFHGNTSIENGELCDGETLFPVACVIKSITAVMIMQLVTEGKIDLSQPVAAYIDDFAVSDPEATRCMTVEHLLNHSSGIDEDLSSKEGASAEGYAGYLKECRSFGQVFPPGDFYSYGHASYIVLAEIIERVTGRSFADELMARILTPLGALGPFHPRRAGPELRVADEHVWGPSGLVGHRFLPYPRFNDPLGHSRLRMRIRDLVQFGRTYLADAPSPELLPAHAMQTVIHPKLFANFPGQFEGLGCGILASGLVQSLGVNFGSLAALRLLPKDGIVVALLTNSVSRIDQGISELAALIFRELSGRDVLPINRSNKAVPLQGSEPYADIAGSYVRSNAKIRIWQTPSGFAGETQILLFGTQRKRSIDLTPVGDGVFEVKTGEGPPPAFARFAFLTDDRGSRVTHVAAEDYVFRRLAPGEA